jgi:O-antigen/teichoic acid export membrane protein
VNTRALNSLKLKIFGSLDRESGRLLDNSRWVFVANGIGTFSGILRVILATRILGAELFGTYTLAIAGVLILQEFLRLNIATGLIRFGARFMGEGMPEKTGALIRYSFFLTTCSIAASVLLVGFYVVFIPSEAILQSNLEIWVILFAIGNGLTYYDALSRSVLKLHYRFRTSSLLQIVMDLTELAIVSITLYSYGANLKAFFIAVIASRIINSLVCNTGAWIEMRQEASIMLTAKLDHARPYFNEFNRYIFGNSLSSTAKVLMNQSDVLLLGLFHSTSTVGLYAATKKLGYAVLSLTDPLMQAVFPQFSRMLHESSAEKIKPMLNSLLKLSVPLSLLVLAISIIFREQIVLSVYGDDYSGGGWAFIFSLIGALQGAVFFWALPLVQSLGLIRLRLSITLSGALLGGIAGLLLIPTMGATGTAIALLLANLFITAQFIRISMKRLNGNRFNPTTNEPHEEQQA